MKTEANIIDAVPAGGGGMVITVTGNLAVSELIYFHRLIKTNSWSGVCQIDNEFDKPMVFTSTFILQPTPEEPGQYFIYSQIFRLVFL